MPTVSQRLTQRRARPVSPSRIHGVEPVAPVVLMVSGGADSTALLLMACTSTLDIDDGRGRACIARDRLHAMHVNHHLRGGASDGDEAFVRELCERLGVPLCVEHASFQDLGGANLEAAAREVRYAAARRYLNGLAALAGCPRSAGRIVTAHSASDRTETFFMNAIRGSGVSGLSSIPRRRNIIVRPLIDSTHEELCRYLKMANIGWREDESNRDTSFLRSYVRHRLMPVAMQRNPNLVRTVAASCDILADEDAFMAHVAATALRSCTRREQAGLIVLDAARLAATEIALARRMVRMALRRIDPQIRLDMSRVEEVLGRAAAGEGSLTLPGGIDARIEFGALSFRAAGEAAPPVATWLAVPGSLALAGEMTIEAELVASDPGSDPVMRAREIARTPPPGGSAVLIDAAALGYGGDELLREMEHPARRGAPGETSPGALRLWVDTPAPGDVMCPLGMHGSSKKLSDILGSERIPVVERARIPVVRTAPAGAVVWVVGVRLDERFRCTPTTRVMLRIAASEDGPVS